MGTQCRAQIHAIRSTESHSRTPKHAKSHHMLCVSIFMVRIPSHGTHGVERKRKHKINLRFYTIVCVVGNLARFKWKALSHTAQRKHGHILFIVALFRIVWHKCQKSRVNICRRHVLNGVSRSRANTNTHTHTHPTAKG